MNLLKKILILPLTIMIFACAGEIGANKYETSAAGQVNSADTGVVISMRTVKVANSEGKTGRLAGGVAGGAAGSMIGGSSGSRVIGAVGGALIGGIAGSAAETKLSEQTGMEYIVKLDNGRVVTITQGTDNVLSVGQRCIVLGGSRGERARIIPY